MPEDTFDSRGSLGRKESVLTAVRRAGEDIRRSPWKRLWAEIKYA